MKIAFFNAKSYEIPFFQKFKNQHDICFIESALNLDTAKLASGCEVVCCFVTDQLNAEVLTLLSKLGIKLIALRSAGYDHVDLAAAHKLNLPIVRVPKYSPEAIAEFTLGMILALSRKLLLAHDRVRNHNFSLEGLLGFNLNKKTIGLIGTGNIGAIVAKLLLAFGCTVLAYDPKPSPECQTLGVTYTSLEHLFQKSDIISLHCPLNEQTHYIINQASLAQMQPHCILINTGRGGLVNTKDLIAALENNKLAAAGLDVYEHEKSLFFADRSQEEIKDELFLKLQKFPNVFITGHQAYFSQEALSSIALTTMENITAFSRGAIQNQVV